MSLATAIAPVQPAGLDLRFRGRCDHAKGAVDLSRYPNLAHTPERGVFTHLTGTTIDAVVDAAKTNALIDAIESTCVDAHATFDELLDAIRYARTTGQV